ncbi:MAG: hypothetical protein V3W34_09805 [Phycisphaerae bacterium]
MSHWRTDWRIDIEKDPEFAAVVEAWPTLPEAVKAGIVAMVRASGRTGE